MLLAHRTEIALQDDPIDVLMPRPDLRHREFDGCFLGRLPRELFEAILDLLRTGACSGDAVVLECSQNEGWHVPETLHPGTGRPRDRWPEHARCTSIACARRQMLVVRLCRTHLGRAVRFFASTVCRDEMENMMQREPAPAVPRDAPTLPGPDTEPLANGMTYCDSWIFSDLMDSAVRNARHANIHRSDTREDEESTFGLPPGEALEFLRSLVVYDSQTGYGCVDDKK